MKTFIEYIFEIDSPSPNIAAQGLGGPDPMAGAGGVDPMAGGDPLADLGGMSPEGGLDDLGLGGMGDGGMGMGGMGMGGLGDPGMGGIDPGAMTQQKTPMELRPHTVWEVLDSILTGKELEDDVESKEQESEKEDLQPQPDVGDPLELPEES